MMQPLTDAELASNTEEYVEELISFWDDFYKLVSRNHDEYDQKMLQEYLKRANLAGHDERMIFYPGQQVLFKNREI